jgi:hypothetical protein
MVLLRWKFRGDNKTGFVIHAKDLKEAERRVHTILPPSFFRATDCEIMIAPTHKLLCATPVADEPSAALPDAAPVQPSGFSSWISEDANEPSGDRS